MVLSLLQYRTFAFLYSAASLSSSVILECRIEGVLLGISNFNQ